MPLYVLDTMGSIPGLTGLFVAGIFSSALSSVSPILNSLSAVTMEDYIKVRVCNEIVSFWVKNGLICIFFQPFIKNEILDKRRVYYMKMLVLGYGGVCIILSFSVKYLGAVLQGSLTIFGVIGGPVSGVFALGILVPYVNQKVNRYKIIILIDFQFYLKLNFVF